MLGNPEKFREGILQAILTGVNLTQVSVRLNRVGLVFKQAPVFPLGLLPEVLVKKGLCFLEERFKVSSVRLKRLFIQVSGQGQFTHQGMNMSILLECPVAGRIANDLRLHQVVEIADVVIVFV